MASKITSFICLIEPIGAIMMIRWRTHYNIFFEVRVFSRKIGIPEGIVTQKLADLKRKRKQKLDRKKKRKYKRNSTIDVIQNLSMQTDEKLLDYILQNEIGCLCDKKIPYTFECTKCLNKWHPTCIIELAESNPKAVWLTEIDLEAPKFTFEDMECPNCLTDKHLFSRYHYN